jgi:hypothetical protein
MNAPEITLTWNDIKFNAFTEDEMIKLKLFHEKFTQIVDTSFIKDGTFASSFSLTIDRVKRENNAIFHGPQEEEIRSIILLVRQIKLQNDEPVILIERILSILKNRSANDKTLLYLKALNRNYKDRSGEPSFVLRGPAPGCIYKDHNELDIFKLWVDGYYFHNDLSKRQVLDDLMQSWPLMESVMKHILMEIIMDSCNWASIIDSILINAILPVAKK